MSPLKYSYVDLPGVKLAYVDTGGAGDAVVLVHALAGTSESWKHQFAPFQAAGYRVIAFDRRGWGKSLSNGATGPQPGTTAEDLHALINYLGIDKLHLIGIAGGAFVCIDYTALHQSRLISLTLAASTGEVQEKEIADFAAAIANPALKWPCIALEVGASYIGSNRQGLAEWEKIFKHSRQEGAQSQPLSSPNTYTKLKTILTPTLVLAGGADQLAPPALMRLWAAHVTNREWAIIPEAGHSAAWEQPEEFNRLVLDFVARHAIG